MESQKKKSAIKAPNGKLIEVLHDMIKEGENNHIKKMLFKTRFISEYTQHSNPILHNKIHEEENLLTQNMTIDMENTFHKDFIIK